jgi:rhamnose utilization protein RhaD (predicted bifunctional aldolase and dehydrogenase)
MDELINISRRYGTDPAFVLAGGGNTSFKTTDRLWVKASGTSLATITEAGFVEMDRSKLQATLDATDWPEEPAAREADFTRRINLARVHPELNQRPSVEVLLHHLLPQRLVVHTHATVVNTVTCSAAGEKMAGELLEDFIWQPYVDPGLILAKSLSAKVETYRSKNGNPPAVVLLANHGLIVAGESANEIIATTDDVMDAMPDLPGPFEGVQMYEKLAAGRDAVGAVFPDGIRYTDLSPAVKWMTDTAEGKAAALAGPLTPDQIVYARSLPVWIDDWPTTELLKSAVERYVAENGFEPWVFLFAGAGAVSVRSTKTLVEITSKVFADAATIYRAAHELGGISVLSPRDRQFIENWEVEAYRRSVAAG